MQKGFIMAEVMTFPDFQELKSEAACKAAGKYRQQGKSYVVNDADIIFFKVRGAQRSKDGIWRVHRLSNLRHSLE